MKTNRSSFVAMVLVAIALFLGACGDNPNGPSTNPTPTPSATPSGPLLDPIVSDMRLREGVRLQDVTALTTPGGPSFPAQTVYRPLASCVEFSLGPGVPRFPPRSSTASEKSATAWPDRVPGAGLLRCRSWHPATTSGTERPRPTSRVECPFEERSSFIRSTG